jgi:ligand-binding sensor domain-containing protein
MRKSLGIFLMVFCSGGFAWGQLPFFQNYSLLKKNEPVQVATIFQDHAGFIWYGTSRGLFKFDGLKYHRFTTADSLPDDHVTAIAEDSVHRIWIGHKNGKLAFIENGQVIRFEPPEGSPVQAISKIHFDKKGTLWFSTLNDGLYYYKENRVYRLDETDGMPDIFVYDITEDSLGAIWAGTDGGVAVCTLKNHSVSIKVIDYGHGLPDNIIKKIVLDGQGHAWMATEDKGVIIYDIAKGTYKPLTIEEWKYGPITDFLFNGNQVWISCLQTGMVIYDRLTRQIKVYKAKEAAGINSINTLLKDHEGNIWAGTKIGVLRTLSDYLEYIDVPVPDGDVNVVALTIDAQGSIWFATKEGLFRRSGGTNGTSSKRQLTGSPYQQYTVISLFADAAGFVWAGLYGEGVLRIDPVTGKIRYFNHELRNGNVLNISGKEQEVWLATLGGATQIKGSGENLTIKNFGSSEGLSSDYIYQVFTDSQGRIWFATDGKGVDMKDSSGIHHFQEGLNSKVVYGFAEDNRHQLWLNVQGEGLYKFDGKKFSTFGQNNPLRDNNISCLVSDKAGNLLVMHDLGIDLYNIQLNKARYLGDEVGIRDHQPNLNAVAKDKNGRIYVGTNLGIVIYSDASEQMVHAPEPMIEGLKVFDKSMDLSNSLTFTHSQNNITINYLGLWYQNPQNLYYEFMLENYDRDWIVTRNHSSTYSSLPPGEFIFHLKTSDTGDFKDAHESILKFVIRPPFWQTIWFYVFIAIGVILLGYWIIRYRERKLIADKHFLEARVRERTLEIQRKTEEIQAQNEEIHSQAEEIKGINENLELLVKERTHELMRKNKALEEYAFINAHNLRAPVASILGLINLMCKLELSQDSKIIVGHLQSSSEKLDDIVRSITEAIEKGE